MEALASYARQADDDGLYKTAIRIRARAIRRCGELLSEIEPQAGARNDLPPQEGAHHRLGRTDAARQAGMSEHQQKTAVRVFRIPQEQFQTGAPSDIGADATAAKAIRAGRS